ncbi:MAG TPA: GNAT family protein [Thermomicrobiales bacterium]|nr:GNAT family protein [Thermomicrobiales bacterium]
MNITGERVALGSLHRGLLPLLTRWENDFPTIDLGGDTPTPQSPEAVAATWEKLIAGERAGWIGFAIYELPGLRPIGVTNLRDIGGPHRTAEFGITITELELRGRGYGTETTRLVLGYAFRTLGLQNVLLDTTADNVAALRCYAKAGFREIGHRRQAHWRDGKAIDIVFMDCLSDDFLAGR